MRPTRHGGDSHRYFDWLEVAARDLLAAQLLLEQEQCFEAAGFHCQQCIEKALKAYLIDQAGQLVDGHNLTWLCRQCVRREPGFAQWLDETAGMNRLYIETRYPSDRELRLTAAEAKAIYSSADAIYNYVCGEVYGPETMEEEPDD